MTDPMTGEIRVVFEDDIAIDRLSAEDLARATEQARSPEGAA